jgi:hypothetical protein
MKRKLDGIEERGEDGVLAGSFYLLTKNIFLHLT